MSAPHLAEALLAALLALGSQPVAVLEGTSEARFECASAAFVPQYRNATFAQDVAEGSRELRIRSTAGLRPSRAAWVAGPAGSEPDPVADFARRASGGARSVSDAVAGVLHAIAARVAYGRGPDLPIQPAEVLEGGEASCVGLSNLSVAALRSLGIEARLARGARLDRRSGAMVPHRWIEVLYPDVGWVFSDPTESVHYVSSDHVVLTPPGDPDPAYDPAVAVRIGLRYVEGWDGIVPVDARPGRPSRLGEGRMASVQYAAALIGRLDPGCQAGGPLRLTGNGRTWTMAAQAGGFFSFPGLDPGRYLLETRCASEGFSLPVTLGSAELLKVEVRPR